MWTASASSRKGTTATTGPKISSRQARDEGGTGASTVGGYQKPGADGADPRTATGASSGTKEATWARWAAEMSGPISLRSSEGSPTTTDRTADSNKAMNRSNTGSCTNRRE